MKQTLSAPKGAQVLLQGNEAIARGGLEAGVAFASGYPGNPSSEIIENLADASRDRPLYVEWSVNEKVALEAAAAASFSGLRALVTMKQNGVNVCLDALTTLAMSGVRAGLVLVSADDPSGISSSNEEDSRFAASLAHLPMLEPAHPQEALEMTRFAFELSEEISNICILRSVSRVSHTRSNVIVGAMPDKKTRPRFDCESTFITMPAVPKHRAMYDKLDRAREIFERSPFNSYSGPAKPRLLIAASGPGVLYAREALEILGLDSEVGLLKLGATYPLPDRFVLRHLALAERILVVEEIDPVLETRIKALAAQAGPEIGVKHFHGKQSGHMPRVGEINPTVVIQALTRILDLSPSQTHSIIKENLASEQSIPEHLIPPREFGFCPGCPHRASYWSIKNVLAEDDRDGFVAGDIGCYTMGIWPTGFRQLKTVHAMGSGMGMASGFGKLHELGFEQPVLTVVGDSTFYHAAVPALINAVYNQSRFVCVVLDNAATAMTGFQPHPGTGRSPAGKALSKVPIEDLCASLGIPVAIVDPFDLAASRDVLHYALKDLDGVRVVIMRRTCALVQGREGGYPYRVRVDKDLCRGEACGCNRYCNRVFRCPGLVWDDRRGRAAIDEVICVGCGVCQQICPAGAIILETAP